MTRLEEFLRNFQKTAKNEKKVENFEKTQVFLKSAGLSYGRMAFFYSFHEDLDAQNSRQAVEFPRSGLIKRPDNNAIRVFPDKIRVPAVDDIVIRERLFKLLSKSLEQFGATILQGRSGTGKTALAAAFAKTYENVAWYSIDSADAEWDVFFRYFEASLNEPALKNVGEKDWADLPAGSIPHQVEALVSCLDTPGAEGTQLIVLDNVHNVFDTSWFADFFTTVIQALSPQKHLLMLSRCQPPTPIWRLRSKQCLGVIDEKLLAFTETETSEFCRLLGLSPGVANKALRSSFGRISKIRQFLKPKVETASK